MKETSLSDYLKRQTEQPEKLILSNPRKGVTPEYRRVVYVRKKTGYQREAYTEKQVFHKNMTGAELPDDAERMFAEYRQCNLFYTGRTVELKYSKSGQLMLSESKTGAATAAATAATEHNREKKYLIPEGTVLPALTDMGIFTAEGKVVASMYDKFRQINRFVELVEDAIDCLPKNRPVYILDFGCGKSYLTFILYYYFTEIKRMDVHITGLDLKEDVIRHCNEAAKRYGYTNLKFEMGNIDGYRTDDPIDMVVTLHACDVATDFALFNAICWKASLILSVPCCQHEMNREMKTNRMPLVGRYGIVKERMAALMTDAIRANLLTACGYKTQILEFVDLSHTPKNLLIRANRTLLPMSTKMRALQEAEQLMAEFGYEQKLYAMLREQNRLPKESEKKQENL